MLDSPVFAGDDDPRRWRHGGPFEQFLSAITAVVKTNTDLVEAAGPELIPHRGGSLWGLPISLTAPG